MKKLVRFTVITSASNFLRLLLVSLKTTYFNLVNSLIGNIYFVESISHTEHFGYKACDSVNDVIPSIPNGSQSL